MFICIDVFIYFRGCLSFDDVWPWFKVAALKRDRELKSETDNKGKKVSVGFTFQGVDIVTLRDRGVIEAMIR
jgi:hypothetical protein